MGPLKDRVAIITGASGNLGGAAARAFLAAGARLALVVRSAPALEALLPAAAGLDRAIVVGDADLTDEASGHGVVEKVVGRFGRVDILLNAVGTYKGDRPVLEEDLATWSFLLDLNLRTTLLMARAVLPQMLRRGSGRIINTVSRAAFGAAPRSAAYGASKAAVLRLSESLASEVRDCGINVNCLAPGTLDTPQNRAAMPEADPTRWVTPAAVAEVAVFLASDAARAVTGAAIPVYGCG